VSELYALLKDYDLLEKTKIYAVIKYVKEDDIKNNKFNNVKKNIFKRCKELELESKEQEILRKITNQRQTFLDDRFKLSIEIKKEMIDKYILKKLSEEPILRLIKKDYLISWAQILSLILVADELKTSQIRKFLSGVRGVEVRVNREKPENFSRQEVVFLKVHLAYAKSRNDAVKPLMDVMTAVIDKIQEKGPEGLKDFKTFVRFVEAVVAYHRFYGGAE